MDFTQNLTCSRWQSEQTQSEESVNIFHERSQSNSYSAWICSRVDFSYLKYIRSKKKCTKVQVKCDIDNGDIQICL